MQPKNIVQEVITVSHYPHISSGCRPVFGCGCELSEGRIDFPREYGHGRFTCKTLSPFMELWTDELKIRHPFEMTGICRGDFYCLSFCLSGGMEWEEQISHARFHLERDTGAFYHIRDIKEICACDSGQHLNGFCLMIHPDRIENIISEFFVNTRLFQHVYNNFKLSYFRLPPGYSSVIKQLRDCSYTDSIRTLYIEGKVSELLAMCLRELSRGDSSGQIEIKLSKTDVAGLNEARRILDASISEPVPIRNLSRMVGLNEYKLKKGFRQLFGTTVHTYLIEKRMRKARELLEQQDCSVSEIAEYVGYSCQSSFSKAFKKIYGFNPSDCF